MTSFAGWGFINSSSSMFAQYGMGIVLNSFFGTILSAAQGVANQISGQLMVFSRTMLMAINPIIGKKAGSNDITNMSVFHYSVQKCLFSSSPFCLSFYY